jgi:hypothetical protein
MRGFTCSPEPTFLQPDGSLRFEGAGPRQLVGLTWDAQEAAWRNCFGARIVVGGSGSGSSVEYIDASALSL